MIWGMLGDLLYARQGLFGPPANWQQELCLYLLSYAFVSKLYS